MSYFSYQLLQTFATLPLNRDTGNTFSRSLDITSLKKNLLLWDCSIRLKHLLTLRPLKKCLDKHPAKLRLRESWKRWSNFYTSADNRTFHVSFLFVTDILYGGGKTLSNLATLLIITRSFQPCWRILANWSQSKIEKTVEVSIIWANHISKLNISLRVLSAIWKMHTGSFLVCVRNPFGP